MKTKISLRISNFITALILSSILSGCDQLGSGDPVLEITATFEDSWDPKIAGTTLVHRVAGYDWEASIKDYDAESGVTVLLARPPKSLEVSDHRLYRLAERAMLDPWVSEANPFYEDNQKHSNPKPQTTLTSQSITTHFKPITY